MIRILVATLFLFLAQSPFCFQILPVKFVNSVVSSSPLNCPYITFHRNATEATIKGSK